MKIENKTELAALINAAINEVNAGETQHAKKTLCSALAMVMPKVVDGITLPEKVEFIAGEWVNSYGNTQQISKIYVNGERVATIEVNGYGNQYEYDSKDWLIENGFLPVLKDEKYGHDINPPSWVYIREKLGIAYSASKTTFNRKKDLKYFGSY